MINFLKNPIKTVNNAIDINIYKSKINELEKTKKDIQLKCDQYNMEVHLKNHILQKININEQIIKELISMFEINNINYDIHIIDFNSQYTNYNIQLYKTMYDSIVNDNIILNKYIDEINKTIQIDKTIYENKIINLSNEIDDLNNKLNIIRKKNK